MRVSLGDETHSDHDARLATFVHSQWPRRAAGHVCTLTVTTTRGWLRLYTHSDHDARLATFVHSQWPRRTAGHVCTLADHKSRFLYMGDDSQLITNYRVHGICFLRNGDWLFYCGATKVPCCNETYCGPYRKHTDKTPSDLLIISLWSLKTGRSKIVQFL